MKHKCQGNLLWPIGVLIWQAGDVVGVILAKSGFSWDFFNLFLWLNQEFDNADGEDCSVGSSPIQEDSLSSCPSLPEVYTLPVRDRPDCPDLKNGAGTNQILSFQISSQQLMHSLTSGLLSELLMWIQCWSSYWFSVEWNDDGRKWCICAGNRTNCFGFAYWWMFALKCLSSLCRIIQSK